MNIIKKTENVYTDTIGQKISWVCYGLCETAARIAVPQIVGNKVEKGVEEVWDTFGLNKTAGAVVSTAAGLIVKIGTAGIMGHVITPLNDKAPSYSFLFKKAAADESDDTEMDAEMDDPLVADDIG